MSEVSLDSGDELSQASRLSTVKPLSLLPVIAIIFYGVAGGPFGVEDAIGAGGPLLTILGIITMLIIWSIPEALITAELSTTFPEDSGYVAWVTAAFGPFWGYQIGIWSWISGALNNAVFPIMFISYISLYFPVLEDSAMIRVLIMGLVSISLSYLNYRGLDIVGKLSVWSMIFILMPFVIMCVLGLPIVDTSRWFDIDLKTVQWGTAMNVMFWNVNYWDSVSTVIGEVRKPQKILPKAIMYSLVLISATYLLPALMGIGVSDGIHDWKLGYFVVVGQKIGGKWLGFFIIAAAAVSQFGQYTAELSSDAYLLLGMSERGFLPSIFSRRSKYNTPTINILIATIIIVPSATFKFTEMLEVLNIMYCLTQFLELYAFLYLRYKAPKLLRPFKIGLPLWGCIVMLIIPTILLFYIVAVPFIEGSVKTLLVLAVFLLFGGLTYSLMQHMRQKKWCKFVDMTPYDFYEALNGVKEISGITPFLCEDSFGNEVIVDTWNDRTINHLSS